MGSEMCIRDRVGSRRATKLTWGLELDELNAITELWADTALQLREQDLKMMCRLVSAQGRVVERQAKNTDEPVKAVG